jgi:hypothetical protein
MRGLWERIVLPSALVPLLMVYPPDKINNPDDPMAIANGQFILIRQAVYAAIDGHRAIKTRMMDDFSLAEVVKTAGYRLFIVEGFDVLRVRLYANLIEIRRGALKAAIEITGGWFMTLLGLLGNLFLNVLPPILLGISLAVGWVTAEIILGILVGFQMLYYAILRVMAFRIPPWTAITYPLGSLIISWIILEGMFKVASGREIKWKDRDVMGRPKIKMPIPGEDTR